MIDEPEIYLHPDVQRQLLSILREAGPDILLATHSTEIMGEADPTEILLVDKSRRAGQRLKDVEGVQAAMDAIGSLQNITLTRLARNRRILFTEGADDFRIIRRFARIVGLHGLAAGAELTGVESGGFTSWDRVKATAWGMEKTLGDSLRIGAVFDRDFCSTEEIEFILTDIAARLAMVHFHERKEIENYLLVPEVLERALAKAITERARRTGNAPSDQEDIRMLLNEITEPLKNAAQAQYIAKRTRFLAHSSRDSATITGETIEWFEGKWADIDTRMEIVGGKEVLSTLRCRVQAFYGVGLTDVRIIDAFTPPEIPADFIELLEKLERYRLT